MYELELSVNLNLNGREIYFFTTKMSGDELKRKWLLFLQLEKEKKSQVIDDIF